MYIQKNTVRPNRTLNFALNNFVGGLNNKSEILEDNDAYDLDNMLFHVDGVMEKRYGSEEYDSLALDAAVTWLDEFKPYSDSDKMIRATNAKLYADTTLIKNVAGQVHGVNYQGMYFFVDGDELYVYGKFPQVTSTHEVVTGTPNPGYVAMKVVNPPGGYVPLGISYTVGAYNYNYTTSTVWYEPCTNELNDTYKGANVIPENPSYIVVHNGRLYVSGSDKDNDNVFITDVQNPFYFAVYLPIQLPPNSDKVAGLYVYDNSVVVGRKNDVYVISGETNKPNVGFDVFNLRKLNVHVGFASQKAVSVVNNFLFFLGSDGVVYSLNSTKYDEKLVSSIVVSDKIDIFKRPIALGNDDIPNSASLFFQENWYLSIKDKVLVYNTRFKAWTKLTKLDARCFYVKDNVLLWGNDNGKTAQFSNDYYDFGVPYEALYTTKNFDLHDPASYKWFKEFMIIAHTFNDYKSDVRFHFEIDYVEQDATHTVSNQMSVWGKTKWGEVFTKKNVNISLPILLGMRGRFIRITFKNSYHLATILTNLVDLDTYPDKAEGVLVKVSEDGNFYLYTDSAWEQQVELDLNQPMRVYQIIGQYEMRGTR